MINFDFLEGGLGIVCPPHFVYDFLEYYTRNIFPKKNHAEIYYFFSEKCF